MYLHPGNYSCSAQLKGGALGSGALFPRPALESMWAMVTSLRGGPYYIRLYYAQHSQRYSCRAPLAHKDKWTLYGCSYNWTSEVCKQCAKNKMFSLTNKIMPHTPNTYLSYYQLAKGWGVGKTNTTTKQLKQLYQQPIKLSSKKVASKEKGAPPPPHTSQC